MINPNNKIIKLQKIHKLIFKAMYATYKAKSLKENLNEHDIVLQKILQNLDETSVLVNNEIIKIKGEA